MMPGQRTGRAVQASDQELDLIIGGDAIKLVEVAERLGKELKQNRLTTSQIRNVFGEVKRLQMRPFDRQAARQLLLLKPRLAYQAGRHGGAVRDLARVLSKAVDRVGEDPQRFANFVEFFEAILAYHRAEGGE
jgi:CRISPR-associated protein Csm2